MGPRKKRTNLPFARCLQYLDKKKQVFPSETHRLLWDSRGHQVRAKDAVHHAGIYADRTGVGTENRQECEKRLKEKGFWDLNPSPTKSLQAACRLTAVSVSTRQPAGTAPWQKLMPCLSHLRHKISFRRRVTWSGSIAPRVWKLFPVFSKKFAIRPN